MKKLLILAKIMIGSQPTPYGFDDEDRLFKKSFSKRLSNQLNKEFQDKQLDYQAYLATNPPRELKNLTKDYDILLLSPYIVDRVNFNQLNDENYYILSIEEFEEGRTKKILEFLNNLDE